MRRTEKWFFIVTAVLMGVAATSSSACSTVGSYRVPTNLELVGQAEVVAVVEVVSAPSEFGDDPSEPRVKVRAIRFLKGQASDSDLALTGVSGWNGQSVPRVVTPLSEPHFSSGLGACIRMFYQPGELVLAMYGRTDGTLHQIGQPFSRSAESVDSVDDLWVRVADRYVALTQGNAATLDARARAAQAALRRELGIEAAATVEDLGRYLDRKAKRRTGWGGANGPDDAAAVPFTADARRPDGGLFCSRSGQFGILASETTMRPALRIGDKRFKTLAAVKASTREEENSGALFTDGTAKPAVFHFEAPEAVLATLKTATDPAAIEAKGVSIAPIAPGDTLYRFAIRCASWR
ncbi:hypothetical protein ACFSC3_08920 [Sphingomonas floccifaciens]|uniref:Uncharacterized protein n=2 Tax=Sphingomonas floccifaciens TaxID=1844115 RepID=A0ABW4NCM1_9SPHN